MPRFCDHADPDPNFVFTQPRTLQLLQQRRSALLCPARGKAASYRTEAITERLEGEVGWVSSVHFWGKKKKGLCLFEVKQQLPQR